VAVGLHLGCAICEAHSCLCGFMVDPLGQHALSCKELVRESSASCLAQRLDSLRPDPGRNTSRQGVPGSQKRRRKETRCPDAGTLAVRTQCHVGCDSCSHTGNILCVAKCATGRNRRSGHVSEKVDQVYALRHSHVFFRCRQRLLVPCQTRVTA